MWHLKSIFNIPGLGRRGNRSNPKKLFSMQEIALRGSRSQGLRTLYGCGEEDGGGGGCNPNP